MWNRFKLKNEINLNFMISSDKDIYTSGGRSHNDTEVRSYFTVPKNKNIAPKNKDVYTTGGHGYTGIGGQGYSGIGGHGYTGIGGQGYAGIGGCGYIGRCGYIKRARICYTDNKDYHGGGKGYLKNEDYQGGNKYGGGYGYAGGQGYTRSDK